MNWNKIFGTIWPGLRRDAVVDGSTHLLRLLPGRSEKKFIEHLGALYHNAYLDRLRAQLDRRIGAHGQRHR